MTNKTKAMLALAAGVTLACTLTWAQPHPPQFRTYGSPHGFGNVVFPGTGTAPRAGIPFSVPSSFAQRLGATVSGWPGYTGAPVMERLWRRSIAWPVIWPVFAGGFYSEQPSPPAVTIILPTQPSTPAVTINQYFAGEPSRSGPGERDTVSTYQAPVRPPLETSPVSVTFLIALKDSSVYTAIAYWVERDTLHYITPQGKHNQVSLELVDRALSEKLNRGRRVEFRLPEGSN